MDPALRELLRQGEAAPEEAIEAIVRLQRPGADVPGIRIVSRFGTVATCRVPLLAVPSVHEHPQVASLKASRSVLPQTEIVPFAGHSEPGVTDGSGPGTDVARSRPLCLTGAGVVVGVVDWGLDVDHPNFVNDDGTTRLLALWDQRGGAGPRSPQPYGYGTVHSQQEINDALAGPTPYSDLDYHPADADRGTGTHATHVTDIAAGNGRVGGPVGVAPEAHLVFVHLADRATSGLATLGNSVRLLEVGDFVARTASARPWVVNLSVGTMGGPHTGTLLVERAFDELLAATPGAFVVQSAGNYERARTHASGTLLLGGSRTLRFATQSTNVATNELEIWYSGADELLVRLEPPGGGRPTTARLGTDGPIMVDGREVGWIYHRARDPNNGDNHVDAFVAATAPAGIWQVTLGAVRITAGRFHAWIERNDACSGCQARFVSDDSDRNCTLGTIATSHRPLIVGAYDGHRPDRPPAPFSSSGPTRDGRDKPDVAACGVGVLAARSAPQGCSRSPGLHTVKSGTSMAAPRVTGAVALCFQAGGRRLTAHQIRALVLGSAQRAADPGLCDRLGHGYLDISALIDTLTAGSTDDGRLDDKDTAMNDDLIMPLGLAPDRIYRELMYRPHGPVADWVQRRFELLAAPAQRLDAPPQPGDLMLSVQLGQLRTGECVRIATPELIRGDTDGDARTTGWYIQTTTLQDQGHETLRRILDARGRLPGGLLLLRERAASDPAQYAAEDTGAVATDSPRWTGTPEQLDFRDRVLQAHLARARRSRGAPQRDLPDSELRKIRGTDEIRTSHATADAIEQLLAAATVDLEAARNDSDPDALRTINLTVTSGYRSSDTQLRLWKQYFSAEKGYYDRTRSTRGQLADGPHSDQAVAYMLTPRGQGGFGLGGRIAAPGYSNHQNGIAVDLYQVRTKGHTIHNDSDDATRARWRNSWFHHWLIRNAARFGFEPLATEEWHWEHRSQAADSTRSRSRPVYAPAAAAGQAPPSAADDYLGGKMWTFSSDRPPLQVVVFCPRAALGRTEVDVLVFAHGLLSGCPRPQQLPVGLITGPPFDLGRPVDASGLPTVLAVPLLDWNAPGGAAIFGPQHARWHELGDPRLFNATLAQVMAEVGRVQETAPPGLGRLIVAGHSRAYDLLEPLAHHRHDPEMSRGALARLTNIVGLDTTYSGDVGAWTDWLAENPRLTVTLFYRPDSPTATAGAEFYARRNARLQVIQVRERHCAVPGQRLPGVLAGLSASRSGDERESERDAVPELSALEGLAETSTEASA